MTFRFDRERQGENANFSILREADVEIGNDPASNHLLGRLLFHAPVLEGLRLVGLLARKSSKEAYYENLHSGESLL